MQSADLVVFALNVLYICPCFGTHPIYCIVLTRRSLTFSFPKVKEPNLIQIVKEFQEEKPLSNCIIFTKTCR